MFDFGVGYTELLVLAIIAIVVVGPKDLPRLLRGLGRIMTKVRGMAGEFQGHINDAMRDAGLEDVKKDLQAISPGNPLFGSSTARSSAKIEIPVMNNDFDTYFVSANDASGRDAAADKRGS